MTIFQATQGISIQKTAKEIEYLTQSLRLKGYSITIKDISNIPCVQGRYLVSFKKSYGRGKSECSGGYFLVNESGLIQYDFFVDGSKHGTHLNSYHNHLHDGFVSNLPVQRIMQFLCSNHYAD